MFGLFGRKSKTDPNPVVERLTKARDLIKGRFDPYVYMGNNGYCAVGALMKVYVDEGKNLGEIYDNPELKLLNEAANRVSEGRYKRIEGMAISLPREEAEEATILAYNEAIRFVKEGDKVPISGIEKLRVT